jgi:hypothetical protein
MCSIDCSQVQTVYEYQLLLPSHSLPDGLVPFPYAPPPRPENILGPASVLLPQVKRQERDTLTAVWRDGWWLDMSFDLIRLFDVYISQGLNNVPSL